MRLCSFSAAMVIYYNGVQVYKRKIVHRLNSLYYLKPTSQAILKSGASLYIRKI